MAPDKYLISTLEVLLDSPGQDRSGITLNIFVTVRQDMDISCQKFASHFRAFSNSITIHDMTIDVKGSPC